MSPYRSDIQGLRAIAIVLVLLAHAKIPGFSGGFVGVDIFFVLSGYLITGLLINEYEVNGSIHLAAFYARRLKRLLPALLVMLVIVVSATLLLLSKQEALEQSASVIYAATWTSNIYYALSTVDYFSELKTRDLFLHTWSLGLEEQFYLLWPVLILLAFAKLNILDGRNSKRTQLLWTFALLFISSLVLSLYLIVAHPLWAFYMMPSRIWQFALGAYVFVWSRKLKEGVGETPLLGFLVVRGNSFAVMGLGLIIGSAILLHPLLSYPGLWAMLPSVGAALVIAGGHQKINIGTSRVLGHPVLVWIGDRSYSLYLWHWPVLMLGFSWGMQSHYTEIIGLVALSLLLAMFSYRWVELPFWKGNYGSVAPTRTILLSILVVSILLAVALHLLNRLINYQYKPDVPIISGPRADLPAIYAYGCDSGPANSDIRPCIIGKPSAKKTIVLMGDSIGAQWISLLPALFKSPEWRTIVLTKSACPMVDEDYFYSGISQIYTVCTEWRNKTLKYMESLRPNIIFVGSAATYDFSKSQWIEGSSRVLAHLALVAERIIVVPGTPSLSFNGPGCLERRANSKNKATVCREELMTTEATDVAQYLKTAVQRFPNARLLNLNDLVCPGGVCTAQTPAGSVVFRDSQHLTNSFVMEQLPAVAERIEKLGLAVHQLH